MRTVQPLNATGIYQFIWYLRAKSQIDLTINVQAQDSNNCNITIEKLNCPKSAKSTSSNWPRVSSLSTPPDHHLEHFSLLQPLQHPRNTRRKSFSETWRSASHERIGREKMTSRCSSAAASLRLQTLWPEATVITCIINYIFQCIELLLYWSENQFHFISSQILPKMSSATQDRY